jgi:beta-galactosidase
MVKRHWICLLVLLAGVQARAGVPTPIVGNRPVDPLLVRVNNPAVISTDGTWRFSLIHGAMVDGKFKAGSAWATASSSQHPPADAIDGKPDTRWCAENAEMPQWWQLDLGKAMPVDSVGINWEFADATYHYQIQLSDDGTNWKPFADRTGGDATVTTPGMAAGRFVRITVLSASDAQGPRWASIREVAIGTDDHGQSTIWHRPDANDPPGSHDDDFTAAGFDDSAWHDIPVPSNWEVLGYSKPTYFGPDDAVGLYRKQIDIPADWAGKKILWHCDGCTESAEVFVNGKRAGYHEGGFTAFDIDLGSLIEPGKKNLLAVRVCKTTPTYDLDTGDYWLLGGIHRESHLLAVPVEHIEDVTVVTKLEDNYTNATLRANVTIAGAVGKDVSVTGKLFNADGTPADATFFKDEQGTGVADRPAQMTVAAIVKRPRLWSAEKPSLYYLLVTLKSGDTAEVVEQRFGFRQIDIKDGVLLFNGVPIKCCGTCRHEEWAAVGHALTEHEWQTDIAMMKAANINAVRTSHYNHAERFLELCDEKGIYVLDEIPACWVDPKDPKLKDAFVQHAAETLARDKNKPCVLAWSCGNESGWGPDFKAMVDYVAATDPTRPRFVSQVRKSQDPELSFNDYHYPGDNDLRKMCTTPGPSVITEGPHIFYNIDHQKYDYGLNDLWGEALAAQWDRVWPSKYLFGAFIWEWQDQGLADKFPDRTGVNAEGLRRENSKGIVTGYRVPKPEYYHVKMVYSPVVTDQREVTPEAKDGGLQAWPVVIRNRYAFTNLSELKCKWQAMRTTGPEELVASGTIALSCAPGDSQTIAIPFQSDSDPVRVGFTNSAGLEVYAVRLHVAGSAWPTPPPPLPAGEFVAVEPSPLGIAAAVPGKAFSIDPKGGMAALTRETSTLRQGIGFSRLNLGELRVDDGDFGSRNDAPWIGSKEPPKLQNIKITGAMADDHTWAGSIAGDVVLVEHPDQVLGQLTEQMLFHADGSVDWSYQLKWTAPDMQAWEFGMTFDLMGFENRFTWFRHGQWTEYPPGHIGADYGTATPADKAFSSTKRDTVWAWIGPEKGPGVVVTAAGSPLHTRCSVHDGRTTLFVSTAVSVDRDFSSGYVDHTRILFKTGHTYSGSFKLRLVDGKP